MPFACSSDATRNLALRRPRFHLKVRVRMAAREAFARTANDDACVLRWWGGQGVRTAVLARGGQNDAEVAPGEVLQLEP